jgi:hypothetical protein
MKKYIIILFSILFFIVFFYYLFSLKNDLIKFRVTKDNISKKKEDSIDYNSLKNKYVFKKCDDICKKEFCDEYHSQKIKYDLCKQCSKEGKCYDENEGLCISCTNNYTCEQLFGCDNVPPINPLDNYCTKCWN